MIAFAFFGRRSDPRNGFTLLEIMLAIGILALLAAVIVGAFLRFKKSSDLFSAAEGSLALFHDMRSRTLSSKDAMQYGVHVEAGRFISFRGAVFSGSDPANYEFLLPQNVEAGVVSLNGGSVDVVFKRLTGETDQYGTVTLRLKDETSKIRVITILKTGIIY